MAAGEPFDAGRFGPHWAQALALIAAHAAFLGIPTGAMAGLLAERIAATRTPPTVRLMQFDDRPQLPLTPRRRLLVGLGMAIFTLQIAGAALLAKPTTGEGDANIAVFAGLWFGGFSLSVVGALCIIRQADIADVFTAALLMTIPPFAVYALAAALAVRGTEEETDVVSAMFFGITVGALTAVLVWAVAMGLARMLKLPVSPEQSS